MIIFSKSDSRTLAINFILIRISRRISQIEHRNLNSGKLIAPIGPFITKTSLIVFFFFVKVKGHTNKKKKNHCSKEYVEQPILSYSCQIPLLILN